MDRRLCICGHWIHDHDRDGCQHRSANNQEHRNARGCGCLKFEEAVKRPAPVQITTPCPSCGNQSLFIGSGGHLTCSIIGACKEPGVERAHRAEKAERYRLRQVLLVAGSRLPFLDPLQEYIRKELERS